jgi:quercetin dioxygenase-like cupin family protein
MEKKTFESLKTFSEHSFVRVRIWQTDKLHCNIYCFEPGQQNSLHCHPVSDEVVFCLEGEGIVVVSTEQQSIKAGETLLVPMNTPHGYINTSLDCRMIISVIQCPLPVDHVPVEPGNVSTLIGP